MSKIKKKKDLKEVTSEEEIFEKKVREKEKKIEKEPKKNNKKTIIIILSVSILFLLIIGFLIYLKVSSDFKYDKYDHTIEVEYKGKKSIKRPDVCFGNIIKCVKIKPKEDGKVNYNKIGSYKIKYVYKYKKKKIVLKQSVIVKDKGKPVITLNDEEIKVCPNGKILKLDVSAEDEYDGDLTDKIESSYYSKKVVVKVEDSSGNKAKKEISVETKDEKGPQITLNGSKNTSVIVGLAYNEVGATAKDDCDGDVKVNISGNVDTSKAGEYILTYSAEDSSGNKSSVERKITVKNRVNGSKVIYLTFDDGPGPHTQRLLDVLDKYNVKVTFFVTNQFPRYQYLIGEEAKRGHAIAVHTLTHKWNIYDSVDAYMNDFNAMNDIIEQQTGSRTKLFRFPGGSSNQVYCSHNKTAVPDIINKMNELGNVYFDWNISSGDAGGTTNTDKVYRNVVNALKADNSIVLQHDIKGFSVNAVEKIIEYGLNNGYTFKSLNEDSPTAHHGVYTCK